MRTYYFYGRFFWRSLIVYLSLITIIWVTSPQADNLSFVAPKLLIVLVPSVMIGFLWRFLFGEKLIISDDSIEQSRFFRKTKFQWNDIEKIVYKPGKAERDDEFSTGKGMEYTSKTILYGPHGESIVANNYYKPSDLEDILMDKLPLRLEFEIVRLEAIHKSWFPHPHVQDLPELFAVLTWIAGGCFWAFHLLRSIT